MASGQIPNASIEPEFTASTAEDFEGLARDRIPIRSMTPADLDDVIGIDGRITQRVRRPYYERLMAQVMDWTGVRMSLIAELEDAVVGFVMARVDYGEFGRTEPVAVMDTIGIRPDYRHLEIGVALLSQLYMNLAALRIERIRTVVPWNGFEIQHFLARNGFRPAQSLCLWRPLVSSGA